MRVRDFAANWLGVLGIVAFFSAWELATRFEILNPFYFPPFSKIVAKGVELFANGTIWEHMWFSLTNFAVGFIIAVVLGVIAGVPMGWYKGISKTFDPLLSGIYATPLIALLPLIIMLFGLGPLSKIIMTILAAVFPILINTMTGIANTDNRLITMSRAFGATDSTIFLKVSVPGSLPLHRRRDASGFGTRARLHRGCGAIRRGYGVGLFKFRRRAAVSDGRDVCPDRHYCLSRRRTERTAQTGREPSGEMEAGENKMIGRTRMKLTRTVSIYRWFLPPHYLPARPATVMPRAQR